MGALDDLLDDLAAKSLTKVLTEVGVVSPQEDISDLVDDRVTAGQTGVVSDELASSREESAKNLAGPVGKVASGRESFFGQLNTENFKFGDLLDSASSLIASPLRLLTPEIGDVALGADPSGADPLSFKKGLLDEDLDDIITKENAAQALSELSLVDGGIRKAHLDKITTDELDRDFEAAIPIYARQMLGMPNGPTNAAEEAALVDQIASLKVGGRQKMKFITEANTETRRQAEEVRASERSKMEQEIHARRESASVPKFIDTTMILNGQEIPAEQLFATNISGQPEGEPLSEKFPKTKVVTRMVPRLGSTGEIIGFDSTPVATDVFGNIVTRRGIAEETEARTGTKLEVEAKGTRIRKRENLLNFANSVRPLLGSLRTGDIIGGFTGSTAVRLEGLHNTLSNAARSVGLTDGFSTGNTQAYLDVLRDVQAEDSLFPADFLDMVTRDQQHQALLVNAAFGLAKLFAPESERAIPEHAVKRAWEMMGGMFNNPKTTADRISAILENNLITSELEARRNDEPSVIFRLGTPAEIEEMIPGFHDKYVQDVQVVIDKEELPDGSVRRIGRRIPFYRHKTSGRELDTQSLEEIKEILGRDRRLSEEEELQ